MKRHDSTGASVIPDDAFAVFDRQDSGCVSFGVVRDRQRLFVKCSTTPAATASLRRAIEFHARVRHPAVVRPLEVNDQDDEVRLTYPWRNGTVLNHATVEGSDRSGLHRFRSRPRAERTVAVESVLDAHLAVARAGFVSVDLYDGCFLFDFDTGAMHLIDLDEYRPGPFVVEVERLPGSTRYMAPEEFRRGATIDERTTVFHLGRTISELLDGCLGEDQRAVVVTATADVPDERYANVRAVIDAWTAATGNT